VESPKVIPFLQPDGTKIAVTNPDGGLGEFMIKTRQTTKKNLDISSGQ